MKKKINYTRYILYMLIIGVVFATMLNSHNTAKETSYDRGFLAGQENAVDIVLTTISENGSITIPTKGGNITLITQSRYNFEVITYTQEIIDTAKEEGYVTLKTPSDEVTLIKLQLE